MGGLSIWHWLIVLAIVVLVFGAGRLPNVMGDLAKGIKAFKANMKDEETPAPQTASREIPTAHAPHNDHAA